MKLPILILALGALGWCVTLLLGNGPVDEGMESAQTTYYASGQIESKVEYEDGKREGLCERWYADGTKMAEGRYEDGRMSGEWRFWNADGSADSQRSGTYDLGERVEDSGDMARGE